MKKLNAIEKSNYINEKYKEYLLSSFKLGGGKLQKLFEEQLEKEELYKGPYIDMNLPFKKGNNIKSLIEKGVVCKSFEKLSGVNMERPLYSHQERSIELIKKGRSAIITTGTGSGKTECFLYPILNELLSDVEKGNNESGVRAIFLYPMNALVNDQIDRVRSLLKNCPEITFGFFTGDTPEKKSDRVKVMEKSETDIPVNELVSREEIRSNPPHLLFTNYSMLEYLLIRPNDYSIFEKNRLKNWKYVVLDEAHTYRGALGIEISLLLRRLTGLSSKMPQFILTSATLGEQGKSENDIISFAHNLTSADYSISDIIFSERVDIKSSYEYKIEGEDYIKLRKEKNNINSILEIANKYLSCNETNVKVILYDLLSRDENVYRLSHLLKKSSKNFNEILDEMSNLNIKKDELIALIDIINMAEKNGTVLFDLKYHSFVRPLSGAYVTYGKNPKLSLKKTNEINGMKAFEVGNCKYCNALYIIGKIQYNEEKGLHYLYQNNEVDIYENYGNKEFVKIDYFLLKDSSTGKVDKSMVESYEVCFKCGEIHSKDNLNASKCQCGDQYRFEVYKVISKEGKNDEDIYNNIKQCPCCKHKINSGVVKALNVGKDEGTALIAQILYEAIDEGEPANSVKPLKLSLKNMVHSSKTKNSEKVKQYIAFSDSRQEASFATVFFDYNHVRMLRKRLIWEVLKEHKFKNLSIDELAAYLFEKIKTKELFNNKMSSQKNAWAAILVDLLKVDGVYDGEGLGLYYFDLGIEEKINEFDEEEIKEVFDNQSMTTEILYNLIQIVVKEFKTTPAINYTKSTLLQDEKKEILGYRRFDNYIMKSCPPKIEENKKTYKSYKSLLPTNRKENMLTRYIKKAFNIGDEQAIEYLEIIFDLLIALDENSGTDRLLVKHDQKEAYQIDVSNFVVKNYKKSKFYQCSKCGMVTPYNINGACVRDKCDGTLKLIDPDEVFKMNYYRNQYKNKKIEKIVIKEHTAQIERDQAKKYQNDFKNKKINILSCSTTFEMGIDIGDLETVFMRNVPPTPANYVQRAGRAGRRRDSAAFILTYCGMDSHDYTYFSNPEKMISGIIKPPFFNVLNKKIILRHLMAASLGFFFRKYPEQFADYEKFIIKEEGYKKFNEYLDSHPNDLNEYINNKILPEDCYKNYKNFKWLDNMGGRDEKMENFVKKINEIYSDFVNMKKELIEKGVDLDSKQLSDLKYYEQQINDLKRQKILKGLSEYCVIPKYGFPIDIVELQLYEDGRLCKNTNRSGMTRDLRVAISEYAPDSEVIVDGNKYTSKYISTKSDTTFKKNWFTTCPVCKRKNIFSNKRKNSKCKYCGSSISEELTEYYIEPINGFKSGITKKSTRMKPKRTYSGEVSYIGNGVQDEKIINFKNVISIKTSSDDSLLVMNKAGFYMCPICGYSEIATTRCSSFSKSHKNYKQFNCSNKDLEYIRLGHSFKTDVARITIPKLINYDTESYAQALSFLYALLEGVSIALGIDRNDIDGILEMNLEYKSYDILLYDNVPGGAGHVKRLLDEKSFIQSLKEALKKVNIDCCDENTSCYKCLRNYYNQTYHDKLKRKYAIDIIKRILEELDEGSSKKLISSKMVKIVLENDGRNPGNETADEIWDDLLEDCYSNNEIKIISELKKQSPSYISNPYYKKTVSIEETKESFTADLLWKSEKVMLFLDDSYDDYKLARKTGWNVYCTKDKFNIKEVLEKVGE